MERSSRKNSDSLVDRELVDMFVGTLSGPFLNHLIGSSLVGFTELILRGEHVEGGIRSEKIQVATSSITVKKSFNRKKEANAMYGQKGRNKSDRNQFVGEVLISNHTPMQQ